MAMRLLPVGSFMSAISNWTISPAGFPVQGTMREKLAFALKQVALALPDHWWQPWEFRLGDGLVELHAGTGRNREALDPDGREALMSCGTALAFMELALKHHGCLGHVQFFPHLDQPSLVAKIHAGRGGERDAADGRLFAAMQPGAPDSGRKPVAVPPDAAMDQLRKTTASARTWLEFARCESSRERLCRLAAPPQPIQVETVQVQGRPSENSAVESLRAGRSWLRERISRWREPQLAVRINVSPPPTPNREPIREWASLPGLFAVVKTKTDDKHGWVAAGQTAGRLKLQARVMGLDCSVENGALRNHRLRSQLRPEFGRKGFVQSILRFADRPSPDLACPASVSAADRAPADLSPR